MTAQIGIVQTQGKDTPRKFLAASAGMATGMTIALREAVKVSCEIENAAIASMAGGDMKLSNQGRRMSAKGGVLNQAKAYGVARVGPVGPVALIENGANPHMIGVGRASKARSRIMYANSFSGYGKSKVSRNTGRKVLVINGHPVMAPVHHPGMRGKGRWKAARDGPVQSSVRRVMRAPILKGALAPFKG